MSPNAKNEILEIMALKVLRGTASDIAESGYYTIMADESSDASNIEQLGQGDDSMLGIYWSDASRSKNVDTVVVHINDVLLRMNLIIQDARG